MCSCLIIRAWPDGRWDRTADTRLSAFPQVRVRLAVSELHLRRARAFELELTATYSPSFREEVRERNERLGAAIDGARFSEATSLLVGELLGAYQRLDAAQVKSQAQAAQLESAQGGGARRALEDLLGRCAELENLLGLRDKQLAAVILKAISDHMVVAQRLATTQPQRVGVSDFRPITELKGRAYTVHGQPPSEDGLPVKRNASPPPLVLPQPPPSPIPSEGCTGIPLQAPRAATAVGSSRRAADGLRRMPSAPSGSRAKVGYVKGSALEPTIPESNLRSMMPKPSQSTPNLLFFGTVPTSPMMQIASRSGGPGPLDLKPVSPHNRLIVVPSIRPAVMDQQPRGTCDR